MDLKPDFSSLAVDLERQELETGGDVSPQIYGQLLAIYLLTNDLANAKLLWKRIPSNYKEETPELKAIWEIARRLIERRVGEVYGPIQQYEWPGYVKAIMLSLLGRVRDDVAKLVGQSYSHISVENLRRLTGLNSDQETIELVNQLKWNVDIQTGYVLPSRVPCNENDKESSQEQLQKLTEYVAFLENC